MTDSNPEREQVEDFHCGNESIVLIVAMNPLWAMNPLGRHTSPCRPAHEPSRATSPCWPAHEPVTAGTRARPAHEPGRHTSPCRPAHEPVPAGTRALAGWHTSPSRLGAWQCRHRGQQSWFRVIKILRENLGRRVAAQSPQWLLTFVQFPILNHRYIPILANHSSGVDSMVHSAGEI